MSDRFIDSGVLVVYEKGDLFFSQKSSAVRFAEWMEAKGYECGFYTATIEGGKVTRRRRMRPDALRLAAKSK